MSKSLLLTENIGDKFSIVLIGSKGVGKKEIVKKLIEIDDDNLGIKDKVPNPYEKEYVLENIKYSFKLWTTSSNEVEFKRYNYSLLRKADCIIFICASNDKNSFNDLDKWYNLIRNDIGNSKIFLINNKTDLDEDRVIGFDELTQKCEAKKIKFYETSAKSGYGIKNSFNEIFQTIIKKIYGGEQGDEKLEQFDVDEMDPSSKGKKGFCSKCTCIII